MGLRSFGTPKLSLTLTMPTISSRSVSYTGNRECPVVIDSLRISATASCLLNASTSTRGIMASAATFSWKVIARVNSVSSSSSRWPPSPDDRIMSSSSSIDLTPASSSRGSMPSFRTVQLAEALRNRITGLKALFTSCIGMPNSTADGYGLAIAMFLGTSSPKIIWLPVATAMATLTEIAKLDDSGTQERRSISGSIWRATAGSAMAPMMREVAVIPSCAPDNSKERLARDRSTLRARLSPDAARRSTWLRSTATIENSPATKKPLSRMSTTTTMRPLYPSIESPRSRLRSS